MARVFVSHSSDDNVYAHAIAEKLESWGYDVFLDFDSRRGIVGGTAWEGEVLHAIRESVAILVCFTESVTNSLWCFGETLIARYEKKPVIPVLLHGPSDAIWGILRQTVQHIDLSSDPEQGYARLRVALDQLVPVNEQLGTASERSGPPYAGLAPLTERQSPFYFGRFRDVRAAIARLQPRPLRESPRILTVTGASGSGKSSLVAAALVPSLRRGALAGSAEWIYLTLSPTGHPSRRLAEEIRREAPRLGSTRDLTEKLEADTAGLSYLLSDVLAETSTKTICLVIDQLEELITVGGETADAFADGLRVAIGELGHDRLVVISTVRVDMLGPLLSRFDVSSRLLEDPLILTPLTRDELESVVVGPAHAVGWDVDGELILQLADDAASVSDPLPLLSFVLRLMYDSARPAGRLTITGYHRTGGVAGALAESAESLLGTLTEDELTQLTATMVRTLVTFSADGSVARRKALRSEIPLDALPGFEILVAGRLLVADVDTSGSPTFEIAHEAMFRHWPRLRDAIELADTDVRYARRLLQGARESWARRRSMPSTDEAMLILGSIDRLHPSSEEIEVLVRWSLASRDAADWSTDELARDVERGRKIIERILREDDGTAQYGLLLLASDLRIAEVIVPEDLALRLVGSTVEGVRRSARRVLGRVMATPELVEISAGQYLVGSQVSPLTVHTAGYALAKHLVTNLEFAEFVDAVGATWPAHWPRGSTSAVESVQTIADFPVVYVNYFDAVAYCRYRSSPDTTVRLPTETEWEIAFLHGSAPGKLYEFPWGELFDASRCNTAESGVGRATLIGYYAEYGGDSASGLSDMSGNVWEWTSSRGRRPDGTEVSFYHGDDSWPDGAAEWTPRVQRGGTFLADSTFARRTFRLVNLPDLALQDFGFRVVHDQPT